MQSIYYFFLPIYITYLFQQFLFTTNPSFAHSCLHTYHRFNISLGQRSYAEFFFDWRTEETRGEEGECLESLCSQRQFQRTILKKKSYKKLKSAPPYLDPVRGDGVGTEIQSPFRLQIPPGNLPGGPDGDGSRIQPRCEPQVHT